MWIMALDAIGCAERLAPVRLDQTRVLGIVAVKAESRRGFRQVVVELNFAAFTGLVRNVAGITSHV